MKPLKWRNSIATSVPQVCAVTWMQRGEAPTPHFVQLYWLLMSYFSACAEVGAYPYVVCQE